MKSDQRGTGGASARVLRLRVYGGGERNVVVPYSWYLVRPRGKRHGRTGRTMSALWRGPRYITLSLGKRSEHSLVSLLQLLLGECVLCVLTFEHFLRAPVKVLLCEEADRHCDEAENHGDGPQGIHCHPSGLGLYLLSMALRMYPRRPKLNQSTTPSAMTNKSQHSVGLRSRDMI